MAIVNSGINYTELANQVAKQIPSPISSGFTTLIHVIEGIGIAILIYIVLMVVKTILSLRTNRKLDEIQQSIAQLNEKLDRKKKVNLS